MKETTYLDVMPSGVKTEKPLTYQSYSALPVGQIVKVPHGNKQVFGTVIGTAEKPDFTTKPITDVLELPPLPGHVPSLLNWVSKYYGAYQSDVMRLFLPPRPDIQSRYNTVDTETQPQSFQLNPEQIQVIEAVSSGDNRSWLLHGVTGSGKTAVYMELCRKQLELGKSSIVLVPEITLATQVIAEFKRQFKDKVLITHSRMSEAQRRAAWRKILTSNEPLIVIGPRSALFTPLSDIGLIVMDECHETSYKQEQPPHYHAREAAARLADITNSTLLLGSATPSAQDIFLHKQGKLELVELPNPIHENTRKISIIDMRKKSAIISPKLKSLLAQTLRENQQSLLFLNRRGSASQVLCRDCGSIRLCPHCDIPQTWHGDSGLLRCHWCNANTKLPARCPECSLPNWRFLGIGTKRIEEEVRHMFPQAKILRLDRDSFSEKTIQEVIAKLQKGEVDILIGTQMIAKGLDLPGVKLVGVVLADTLLHIPDIYSGERTYQLLHQVIGRSGRSVGANSSVVIQTYATEHPAIKLASEHKFHEFIEQELADRKQYGYPPYKYILKLSCKRKTQKGARIAATKLAKKIASDHKDISLRGPAPAWREQLGGHWYWNIIVTSSKRGLLLDIMNDLPSNWRADIDPVDLL